VSGEARPVSTPDAPVPTGPFSQAVIANGFVFTAGQAGRNRDTGQMGDLAEQTTWSLRNIAAILAASGSSMDRVVKTTIFVKEGCDTAALNGAYRAAFGDRLPARSLVLVSRLKGPEMLVEIEAVATEGSAVRK
jgi:2-iminobutanoate/2-iminopropanoate deaminase